MRHCPRRPDRALAGRVLRVIWRAWRACGNLIPAAIVTTLSAGELSEPVRGLDAAMVGLDNQAARDDRATPACSPRWTHPVAAAPHGSAGHVRDNAWSAPLLPSGSPDDEGAQHVTKAADRPRRRPTLDDVAAAAGVSRAMVSIVLRGAPGAREETRAKVLAAAERIGYRPDTRARLLQRGLPADRRGAGHGRVLPRRAARRGSTRRRVRSATS